MSDNQYLNPAEKNHNRKINYEKRILRLILLGGFPSIASLALVLYIDTPSTFFMSMLILVSVISWFSLAFVARKQIFYPLYTISNLLESLREGDYSLRGTQWDKRSGIGGIVSEINTLSETLRTQRIEAEEAASLLKKVVYHIDVSVFAFNSQRQLKFLNPAAEKLLGKPASYFSGKNAEQMGLDELIQNQGISTIKEGFGHKAGHWQVVYQHFRDEGISNHLLVVSDISKALKGEERKAWKNLIRVLGHELNNSLTPIQTIAATFSERLERNGIDNISAADFASGLSVINKRAEALSRFVSIYSKLAKLPEPTLASVPIRTLLQRVIGLQLNQNIALLPGPDIKVSLDSDQIEQLLINLLRNAQESMLEADKGCEIEIAWREENSHLHIMVRDQGCGLVNTENLFVPFYTTKPNGTGIGLVLCQQIAEAHNGHLSLLNRVNQQGCEARLVLPLVS